MTREDFLIRIATTIVGAAIGIGLGRMTVRAQCDGGRALAQPMRPGDFSGKLTIVEDPNPRRIVAGPSGHGNDFRVVSHARAIWKTGDPPATIDCRSTHGGHSSFTVPLGVTTILPAMDGDWTCTATLLAKAPPR